MTEKELKLLISKKQKGLLTENEEALLASFDKKMMEKNKDTVFLNDRHKSILRRDIFAQISSKKSKTRFLNNWLQIAAVLLVSISIAGVGWYYSTYAIHTPQQTKVANNIKHTTTYGKKLTITLPDGSIVKLNSGTNIEFPETFKNSSREVFLTGEAFFEVKKDPSRPFIVKTPMITTRVLGTSFNIKAYDDENTVEVTLATGKIGVAVQGAQEIVLTPSYQLSYNKLTQKITHQKVDLDPYLGWKDGVLRFDNETLITAIPKLEKWYNVRIKLQNQAAENCSFTGVFSNASLVQVLEHLSFVKNNLDYKIISSGEIEIIGNCN